MFACAAMAEHKLTGADTYHVITPTTTRRTPAEYMTTGWFTGLVPINVAAAGQSFSDRARRTGVTSIRASSWRTRTLRTHPGLGAGPGDAMHPHRVSRCCPTSTQGCLHYLACIAEWNQLNGRVYSDVGDAHQIGMWVNRLGRGHHSHGGPPQQCDGPAVCVALHRAMKAEYLDVVAASERRFQRSGAALAHSARRG